jgi:hypothetical protein
LAAMVASAACASASPGPQTQPTGPIEITLERTICFGMCPEYKVTLRGDGTVTYVGRQFVRVTGEHTWKIDPAAVRALAAEMEQAGFFQMEDKYTALITDHPTTYTSLTIGGRSKKIMDYIAGPPKLKEIETRIDVVSKAKGYVSIDGNAIREMQQHGWRATGDEAETWLWRAAAQGDADTMKALLAAGGNARLTRAEDGLTLVMQAVTSGDADTVRVLIDAGGERTARDRGGRNAADRARDGIEMMKTNPERGFVPATGRPKQYELILKLLTDA